MHQSVSQPAWPRVRGLRLEAQQLVDFLTGFVPHLRSEQICQCLYGVPYALFKTGSCVICIPVLQSRNDPHSWVNTVTLHDLYLPGYFF